MNRLIRLAIGIGFLCCCTLADAAEKGSTGGEMLRIGVGARPAAMGESFCAVGDDVNSIYYNPAGLARLQKAQCSITHQEWLDDVQYQSIGYIRSGLDGVIGVNVAYLSMGKLDGRSVEGNRTDSFDAGDIAVGLIYAKPLKRLAIGVGLKALQQRIASEKATAMMTDMGALVRLNESLSIGATLQNLGTGIMFINERDRLPLTFKLGACKTLKDRLLMAVDISRSVDSATNLNIGAEWMVTDMFALRTGYNSGRNQGSIGAGFHIKGCQIDYTFVPYSDLGDTHRISYSFVGNK